MDGQVLDLIRIMPTGRIERCCADPDCVGALLGKAATQTDLTLLGDQLKQRRQLRKGNRDDADYKYLVFAYGLGDPPTSDWEPIAETETLGQTMATCAALLNTDAPVTVTKEVKGGAADGAEEVVGSHRNEVSAVAFAIGPASDGVTLR